MAANENKNETDKSSPTSVDLVGKKILGARGAHSQHSGRRLPLHYTSYAFLFFMLVFAGSMLLFARVLVEAGPPQTEQGSISLSGVVPGPPPSIAAVINSPKNGDRLSTNTTAVSGTCETNRLIEIYRNGSFAGSTTCTTGGAFSLLVTLVPDQNDLVARTKDNIGQYGPNSATVTVFYDVPATDESGKDTPPVRTPQNPTAPPPLLLITKSVYVVSGTDRSVQIQIEIDGGVSPFAIAVDWGDGTLDDLISAEKEGNYSISHAYEKSGQFTITITATDKDSRKSSIQTVAIIGAEAVTSVTGSAKAGGCTTVQCQISQRLISAIDIMWVPFSIASLMTASFWLGEKIMVAKMGLPRART